VLILVGYSQKDVEGVSNLFADIALAATETCQYCTPLEKSVPIHVLSGPKGPIFPQLWAMVKHYD
jgi:hypothetical protein